MVKDDQTVIEEWDQLVNMTADELEAWLKEESSQSSGWSKDDGSGETIGHESGRKIIEILQKNPNKDPKKYDEDDIAHMRKVVAYCKRHLAQEEKAKQDPESRSARSLKNWGHDPQKA
ncbi:dna-binding protein [Rutstroemia sp. NJR-2017a BBW]|nr:dna-binding protein [Rutstroemia sp. NJR-2017a BBW]